MEDATLLTAIVTALAAYVAKDAKELVEEGGQKAYDKCKELAKIVWDKLRGNPKNEMILEEFKDVPQDWDKPLQRKLEQACQENTGLIEELRALFEAYQQEQKAYILTIQGDDASVAQGEHVKVAPKGIAVDVLNAEGGSVVVGTQINNIRPDSQENTKQDARTRYFTRLYRFCQALPLEPLGGGEQEITLDEIYIKLNTTATVEREDKEGRESWEEQKRPVSALAAFAGHQRMLLLGRPGSGKSTFAKKIISAYAGREIGKKSQLIDDLETGLLPVWITLRNLMSRIQDTAGDLDGKGLVSKVAGFLEEQLKKDGDEGFWGTMQTVLISGEALLVFDGLDEVPEKTRKCVRQMVVAVVQAWQPKRILMTCRVRSYQKNTVFKDFKTFTLADLVKEQIDSFCKAWYEALYQKQQVQGEDKSGRANDLMHVIDDSKDLRELAGNPMLLTTMAVIHQKETRLPTERVKLYKMAVDVLLRRWQSHRNQPGFEPSKELVGILNNDERLLRTMEMLAYETHKAAGKDKKQADLERWEALKLLAKKMYLGSAGLAEEFLDYVDQRSGLFIGLGGGSDENDNPSSYVFPHRTFQEYLAGCYMITGRDAVIGRRFDKHIQEGDYWYVASQFGVEELYHNRRNKETLFELAYRLYREALCEKQDGQRRIVWSGYMAVVAGIDEIEEDADNCPKYLEGIKTQSLQVLQSDLLSPLERVEAGRNLAQLGDPRRGVLDSAHMAFCQIPRGKFWLGDDEEAYECPELNYDYWLSTYPVTVSQFKQFSDSGGYQQEHYWPEAAQAEFWKEGKVKFRRDKEWRGTMPDLSNRFNYMNHPMVDISWFESLAYCRWLTERFLEGEVVSDDLADLDRKLWYATLPSEVEWEKAARGSQDQRKYPFAGKITPNLANYHNTGIGSTSAVGCFPGGASPCDCQDMSGNVWEWCRNTYENYPYKCDD
ncbi:NACHT domain-containing protein, partial [Planctomycetota bacterium]